MDEKVIQAKSSTLSLTATYQKLGEIRHSAGGPIQIAIKRNGTVEHRRHVLGRGRLPLTNRCVKLLCIAEHVGEVADARDLPVFEPYSLKVLSIKEHALHIGDSGNF